MTFPVFFESLLDAAKTTAMVFMIAIGALVFNNFVTMSGLSSFVANWIGGLNYSPMGVMEVIILCYFLLGMNVFVLKSVLPGVSLRTILTGIAPFLLADIVRIGVVLAFPAFVMFLPTLLYG